ncbi:MAG: ribonuclease HI family protein [Candidatus Sumerlaeaceae bacterium]
MAVSPEVRRLAQQALKIRNSQVPLHRVIDILATEEGDISTVMNRFRDIRNEDLRRALHQCAVLLRQVEQEAGLTPAWEQGTKSAAAPAPQNAASQPQQAKTQKPVKIKFRPDELLNFEDETSRGQVRMAKVYVDGASKGNPGDAGIGIAMFSMEGKKIAQLARAIGLATNNIAEYTALIEAMQMAKRMGIQVLHVISDSELMVKQMTGLYKVKNTEILKKVQEAQALKKSFERFNINYVGREYNTLADALSTLLLKKKEPDAPPGEPASDDVMGTVDDFADEGSTE